MESQYENLETYDDFRRAIAQMISGSEGCRNSRAGYLKKTEIPERLVQSIWMDGHIKKGTLQTVSGKTVEIIRPGRWNKEKGPDFLAVEIRLHGKQVKGDIEIHVNASDWTRHEHDHNFEYNNCILHAFLFNDDNQKKDYLFNGNLLERFHLEPHLFPDLSTLCQTLSADDYRYREATNKGKCSGFFSKIEPEFLSRFFDLAGDRRIEEKVQRLSCQLPGESLDQVFYQALMTSMGYKGGKTLFFLLSKRAPLEEMLRYSENKSPEQRTMIIQAILFHVANLIPTQGKKHTSMDKETIEYLNNLNKWWMQLSGYFSDRILPPTRKWYAQVRPSNFPPRRMAGIARLLTRLAKSGGILSGFYTLFQNAAEANMDDPALKRFLRETRTLLTVSSDPFWSQRYSFTSKKAKQPLTLIGASRAQTVLFNALIPMLILKCRNEENKKQEQFLWRCIRHFPPLPTNIVTKFMRHRLFADDNMAHQYIFNERRQQALFQIFYDCCNNNEVSCEDCYFYREMKNQVCDG